MKQIISIVVTFLVMIAATVTTMGVADRSVASTQKSIATIDEILESTTVVTSTAAPTTELSTVASAEVSTKETVECTTMEPTDVSESAEDEDGSENFAQTGDYSDDDLELLARVIYAEAGCSWTPDEVQLKVGSVVLNRVNSEMYPDNIRDVLYDPGQYVPSTFYLRDPDGRTIANARQLLENGSVLPPNVLGQNGNATGDGIYDKYYDEIIGSTIYFTYVY